MRGNLPGLTLGFSTKLEEVKLGLCAPGSYYDFCQAVCIALRGTNTVLRQLSAAPELPLDDQLVASLENHPAAVRSAVNHTVRLPYAAVRGEVDSLGTRHPPLNLPEIILPLKERP